MGFFDGIFLLVVCQAAQEPRSRAEPLKERFGLISKILYILLLQNSLFDLYDKLSDPNFRALCPMNHLSSSVG